MLMSRRGEAGLKTAEPLKSLNLLLLPQTGATMCGFTFGGEDF